MTFAKTIEDHQACFESLKKLAADIENTALMLAEAVRRGAMILICGNGGSAADAQHFAAELIGRFEKERESWPAVALTTDTSILTAIGNDYGFDEVFARQVQGLGRKGDVLIGLSTSGNSDNVLKAARIARLKGLATIGLLGRDGGRIRSQVDRAIVVEQANTARIQESHIFILHYWAKVIEQQLAQGQKG